MSSDERRKNFIRACEFFDKALAHDPACAVAAQGLAIALAEDALGTLGGALGAPAAGSDPTRAAREALDVFAKVCICNYGSSFLTLSRSVRLWWMALFTQTWGTATTLATSLNVLSRA